MFRSTRNASRHAVQTAWTRVHLLPEAVLGHFDGGAGGLLGLHSGGAGQIEESAAARSADRGGLVRGERSGRAGFKEPGTQLAGGLVVTATASIAGLRRPAARIRCAPHARAVRPPWLARDIRDAGLRAQLAVGLRLTGSRLLVPAAGLRRCPGGPRRRVHGAGDFDRARLQDRQRGFVVRRRGVVDQDRDSPSRVTATVAAFAVSWSCAFSHARCASSIPASTSSQSPCTRSSLRLGRVQAAPAPPRHAREHRLRLLGLRLLPPPRSSTSSAGQPRARSSRRPAPPRPRRPADAPSAERRLVLRRRELPLLRGRLGLVRPRAARSGRATSSPAAARWPRPLRAPSPAHACFASAAAALPSALLLELSLSRSLSPPSAACAPSAICTHRVRW